MSMCGPGRGLPRLAALRARVPSRSDVGRWLTVAEPSCRRLPWPAMVLVVLSAFVIEFGAGIVNAVDYLADPAGWTDVADWTAQETIVAIAKDLGISLLGIAVALVAVRLLAGHRLLRLAPGGWRAERRAAAAFLGLYGIAQLINELLPTRAYPRSDAAGRDWFDLSSSLTAGPTEEIIVLAAPVVLLRAARMPWSTVILIAAALRLSFHIYYGWATLGLVVWAVGLVIVYAHTRALIGLIVMHSLLDVAGTVASYWSNWAGLAMIVAACAFFFAMTMTWLPAVIGRWSTSPPGVGADGSKDALPKGEAR